MPKIEYFPAQWNHWLPIMHLKNFSVMKINNQWWVMPDWNNPNLVRSGWVFNPLYNTALVPNSKIGKK